MSWPAIVCFCRPLWLAMADAVRRPGYGEAPSSLVDPVSSGQYEGRLLRRD